MSNFYQNTQLFPNEVSFMYTQTSFSKSEFIEEQQKALTFGSEQRRADFLTVRFIARELLKKQGSVLNSILLNKKGKPLFPKNSVGSFSHTKGCWVAVVSSSLSFYSLGIDVENKNRVLSLKQKKRVLSLSEQQKINQLSFDEQNLFALIFFSLKESIYKNLDDPSSFHFSDIELSLDSQKKPYITKQNLANADFKINYVLDKNWLFTGAWNER